LAKMLFLGRELASGEARIKIGNARSTLYYRGGLKIKFTLFS